MLRPENCSLVTLDAPDTGLAAGQTTATEIAALSEVADMLGVPAVLAVYPAMTTSGLIDRSSLRCPPRTISFEPAAQVWATTELARAIAATSRSQLVICGYWLEDSLTLLAAHAMRSGLDVYVAIDASGQLDPAHSDIVRTRLTQFNAVVTTVRQVIREWAALAADEKLSATLVARANALPVRS